VDYEGNLFSILDEIIYRKKGNDAVHADDAFVTINGKRPQGEPRRDGNFVYVGKTEPRVGRAWQR
jgi:hypothetical protein